MLQQDANEVSSCPSSALLRIFNISYVSPHRSDIESTFASECSLSKSYVLHEKKPQTNYKQILTGRQTNVSASEEINPNHTK